MVKGNFIQDTRYDGRDIPAGTELEVPEVYAELLTQSGHFSPTQESQKGADKAQSGAKAHPPSSETK